MEGKRKEEREGGNHIQSSSQPPSTGILNLQCTENLGSLGMWMGKLIPIFIFISLS